MKSVYKLVFLFLLLLTSMKSQAQVDLSIQLATESELTAIPRAQLNGSQAICIVNNIGEELVNNVYIEYNYYEVNNTQNPVLTLYSSPFNIDVDTSLVVLSESMIFLPQDGTYELRFLIKTDKEDQNIDDNVVIKNIEISEQMALDDGTSVASVGIGNGVNGELGQMFSINKDLNIDAVSIYLENITSVMTGEPVSINIYEFTENGPQNLVIQSDTLWINSCKNDWFTISFPEESTLSEGEYLIAVVENDKNLNLGMAESIFTPGKTWFRHDNIGWTDAQSFNFSRPFMIRPHLRSSCTLSSQEYEVESCEYFISYSGENTWFESGIFEEILPSYNFCDSVIIYDLTITEVNTNISQSEETLIVQEENADNYQWFDCNTGALIPNETNQIFNAQTNGSYQVLVNKGSCSFFSDCHTVLTVGTIESSFDKQIEIYPNPNDGFVNINMKETIEEINIKLIDLSGMTHVDRNFNNTQFISFEVDIPSGTYIVQIQDKQNRRANLKIIKQ
jgi:hypothetical protein